METEGGRSEERMRDQKKWEDETGRREKQITTDSPVAKSPQGGSN